MSTPSRFHDLRVAQVRPDAAGAVAITLDVPEALAASFAFKPGQFLTLRAQINGADVRRSYSICSSPRLLARRKQLEVGIRPVRDGVFSNWAAQALRSGDTLAVMAPEGRFVSTRERALHRVGFAAGSGITPILSIMQSTLEEQPEAKFTLVYGNRNMAGVMFNEALQDIKDRYPDRVTMVHILSRQAQESDLLEGRIDGAKVRQIIDTLLPVASMDEVFICGPEGMIEATQNALLEAGVKAERIHAERFTSPGFDSLTPAQRLAALAQPAAASAAGAVALTVILDGKQHQLRMQPEQRILDVALAAGLDLPYSCKGGVCCTCRAKVMDGSVQMDKNFTLEAWETDKGFVLSCQSRPTSPAVTLSYDER